MPADESLRVRVVYALPDVQVVVEVVLDPRATVADAVKKSRLTLRYSELAGEPLNCAIFGRVAALTDELRDGDRVDILRPLLVDPKEQRRRAAAQTGKLPGKKTGRTG
jgi:uncharacterized protein